MDHVDGVERHTDRENETDAEKEQLNGKSPDVISQWNELRQ